ncbi:asparagine synthase-related protein [Ellagibacter isourolithinifaciens]|uniref:asparagine synthase-related protein n=1 Tax=Ellagibacter isourolithinifaciens TaxID=2137581 RepID=UPI003F89B167
MDLNQRPDDMVRITTPELAQAFIDEQVAAIREQIGDKKVLLALSGGVDSSVVAALLIKAIGKQLICVHVNNGLMRKGESEQVFDVFKNQMDANLVYVDATDRFLGKLVDVAEPEAKRKIIGAEFIRVLLATGTHWMPPQVDVGSTLATRSWIRISVLEPQGPRKRQT